MWLVSKCQDLPIRTHFFGAGLFGRFAGLPSANAVGCQDSELVLHPGTQLGDGG